MFFNVFLFCSKGYSMLCDLNIKFCQPRQNIAEEKPRQNAFSSYLGILFAVAKNTEIRGLS